MRPGRVTVVRHSFARFSDDRAPIPSTRGGPRACQSGDSAPSLLGSGRSLP